MKGQAGLLWSLHVTVLSLSVLTCHGAQFVFLGIAPVCRSDLANNYWEKCTDDIM